MIKDDGFPNKKIVDQCFNNGQTHLEEVVDKSFNGVYSKRKNTKMELSIIVILILSSLIIPTRFIIRLLIASSTICIFEFFFHRGGRFLFRDIVNHLTVREDLVDKSNLKLGKFKPIVIGLNDEDLIEVREVDGKQGMHGLKQPRFYIADKETKGDMIFRYTNKDPIDLNSVSNKLVEEMTQDYVTTCMINEGKLNTLKSSNYFNNKK